MSTVLPMAIATIKDKESMVPLLEVRQISKTFPIQSGVLRQVVGNVRALVDVSFQLDKGETLAIVGGSGCGKSTLARIIAGLLPVDRGELLWEGKPLEQLGPIERAAYIQMVFQDPYASLNPKLSVGTQLKEVAPKGVDSSARCIELLESVGLSADALSHYPFQFSGGQRQRIAIARALAKRPALLIADEPLSALDVTIQAQVLDLLKHLRQSYGLSLLFITHDLAIVDTFADRVIVLQDGRLVEEGPTRTVLSHPRHAYTQALLKAIPRIHGPA